MSLLIDTREKRDVATAYIVGAYLFVKTNERVLVKLTRQVLDVLCSMNKKYGEYVIVENRGKYHIFEINESIV